MPATLARQEFVSSSSRWVVAQDTTIKTAHPLAQETAYESGFDALSDAQTHANLLKSLYGTKRDVYTVTVVNQKFQRRIGETLTLKSSRFGLAAGRDFIIIGVAEDATKPVTTLRVWG